MAGARAPITDDVTVALIGGGFAGLIAGARLKQAGIDDIRIIEKGGDFGGTWYWNRYPGAQCDVESYIYLPLLEETGYVPSEKYARAPEILEHCHRIAEHFGLYDNACLATEGPGRRLGRRPFTVDHPHQPGRPRWRPASWSWATVPSIAPSFPRRSRHRDLPRGHSFHTSRWDYDYYGRRHEREAVGG